MAQTEVLALLETYSVSYSSPMLDERILLLSIAQNNRLERIAQRAAFSHSILEIYELVDITQLDLNEEINRFIEKFDPLKSGINEKNQKSSFSVRFRLIGDFQKGSKRIKLRYEEHAARLGEKIRKSYTSLHVDLNNPMIKIEVLVTPKRIYYGKILFNIERKKIQKRTPSKRAFFHPASMNPFILRGMINLSNVKEGDTVFDPFVGAGGVPIEALDMNIKALGGEIKPKMLYGTRLNVEHFFGKKSMRNVERIYMDAMAIPLRNDTIQAIVTDPPYGINASLGGKEIEKLLEKTIEECYRILKKKGRLTLCAPSEVPLEVYAKKSGFKEIRKIYWPVHRSLTRKIMILEK
ncbi:MAG: DNA methyltransferase [Promethearchaeota archaeon]